MTRQAFLDRLRAGLRGLPTSAINDIVADYQAHFAEGVAAGRTEAEIAAALGEPDRVIRELLVAAAACLGVGAVFFAAGPFFVHGAPVAAIILAGLGLISTGTCIGCLSSAASIAFVNGLVWYGRLHITILKPALQPKEIVA